ncbi:putative DNA polymerase POL4, partial [Pyronema domesticum]
FIPNNIKNITRKLKVQRAHEHGAFCISGSFEETQKAVTHIIADSSFEYPDILQAIGQKSLPDHIIIVKDNFPSDCIQFRRILDHKQYMYLIPGRPAPKLAHIPLDAISASSSSSIATATPKSIQKEVIKQTPHNSLTNKFATPGSVIQPHGSLDVIKATPYPKRKRKQATDVITTPGPNIHQDDLDLIIATAKQHPFLDSEDISEDDDRDTEDEDSHENPRKNNPRTSEKIKTKGGLLSFQCMHPNLAGPAKPADDVGTREGNGGSMGTGEGPNERIIKVLSELESHYTLHSDPFRALSYRKAISSIRRHPYPLLTASAALKLPSIGPSLASKIEEIASTGNLNQLDTTKTSSEDKALKLFLGIYGVGPKKAREWVLKGYTTLEEIREKEKLTEAQKVGVERHADFGRRIPREEVREHGRVVEEVAREIDQGLVLEVMGSYRRGVKSCGDIDIMITKEGAEGRYIKLVLDRIVERLTERGFLKAALAASKGDDATDGSKWYGASQLSPDLPWRRIDFLVVPWAERGAALLYFTGNVIFNRSMRLLASKKGYVLNQRGLYLDVIRGPKRQKLTEGTLVEGESEQKIFEILGIPYRPPEERNA